MNLKSEPRLGPGGAGGEDRAIFFVSRPILENCVFNWKLEGTSLDNVEKLCKRIHSCFVTYLSV